MDGLKCEFHSALPEGRDVTNEQCARALSMTHAFRFLAVGCIAHQGKLCCMFNLLGEVTPIFLVSVPPLAMRLMSQSCYQWCWRHHWNRHHRHYYFLDWLQKR